MPEPRTRVIAVANQKGGVGKSTTAVSLGAALAELGKRVLVVDLDPQGNASTGLGIRHEAREITVYDVLASEAAIDRAIIPTPIENLFAIPSTIDLAGAEIELVSQFSRELRLRKAIEPLTAGDDYDFILLDCPPSLGLLTVNALAAAEELIVPIQCEYYALEGLGQLLRNVRLVQQNVNQHLRLTGIVMTMYDPRTKLSEQVVEEVRRYFGDRVYETIIPRTVRLSEAPGFGQPITVYDPRSRGAQSYRDLAQEVAAKLPDDSPLPVIEDLPAMIVPPAERETLSKAAPARAPRPLVPDADLDETSGVSPVEFAEVEEEEPHVGAEAEVALPEEFREPEPEVEYPVRRWWERKDATSTWGAAQAGWEDDLLPGDETTEPSGDRVGEAEPVVEPEVQSPEPEVQSPEPEVQSPEPQVQSPEPQVQSPEEEAPPLDSVAEDAEPSVAGWLERDRIVVVDEELEGERGNGESPPEPEPAEGRKRRWNPFRRGGDR